jgi:multiple sugar transport system substrate-binding protein
VPVRVVTAVMILLAACTSSGPPAPATSDADIDLGGPVSVTIWHALTSDPQRSAFEAAVKKFNETNGKGITVTPVVQGSYAQLYQKTLAAIQANALPDLAHAYESQVADYQKAGVVLDLDPYVQSKKNGLDKASQDDVYKSYLEGNRFAGYQDQLLSFPFTKSLFVMYTNMDVLKKVGITSVPRTWPDFEDAVKRTTVKDSSGKTTQYGWAQPIDASDWDAFVYSLGGKLLSDDNKTVAWNGQQGLQILQMLDRLTRGGYMYTPTGSDWQSAFAQGKVAFTMGSTSGRPFIAGAMKTPVDWIVSAPPQADPAKPRTVMYGANVAIFKSTPQKQLAAWYFVKWFNETAQTADWSTKSYYMPVRKSAANDAALKQYWSTKDPQGKQSFDLIGVSYPEPNVRGWQDVRDVIVNMWISVTTRRVSPDQALRTAGQQADQILKDAP